MALSFDDAGRCLFAGMTNGSLYVFEAIERRPKDWKFKLSLSHGGITCITVAPGAQGSPLCQTLFVNSSCSDLAIVDCTYAPASGSLTNLSIRHRLGVVHSLLPIKS